MELELEYQAKIAQVQEGTLHRTPFPRSTRFVYVKRNKGGAVGKPVILDAKDFGYNPKIKMTPKALKEIISKVDSKALELFRLN